ncbi:MAG: hypothetical protein NVSMB52_05030 [Chloroflexota bacterium]
MNEPQTPQQPVTTIVACAAEDRRRARVFEAAVEAARSQNARLILYDVDAASLWTEPFSDLGHERYQQPMSPAELRHMNRIILAEQVEEARGQGVQAWGWLPSDTTADAMVQFARDVGATCILLSMQLESPTFIQRLHRLTAKGARKSAGVDIDVVLVEGDSD